MFKKSPCLFAIALGATLLATPVFAQSEVEPNNTIAQANGPIADGTITGTYSANIDIDVFRIDLAEASALTVAMWGPTVGVCPNGSIDPVLTLLDAGGNAIATDDDTTGLCPRLSPASHPVVANLPAGTYYIKATVLFGVFPASYTMVVSRSIAPKPINEGFFYQGRLDGNGQPFTGTKRVTFSLWNHGESTALSNRLSLPIQCDGLEVTNGLFSVELDFNIPANPANFDGTERYLQIEVADVGGGNSVVLSPRQRLAPSPHAIVALRAGVAKNAETATLAANATFASQAGYADSANTANSAFSASFADSVNWSGISNMPGGFGDGVDNGSSWIESATVAYTSRNVGIGTSAPGAFDLAVSGTAAKSGGGSWSVFSDERLKHDIMPLSGTLDRLLKLRGYSYEYDPKAVAERLALPGIQIGLLAQEVERVFPDWVAKDAQGYRYVTERATTALMVEALRDLRAEKDSELGAAKEEIKTLRTQAAELSARLERLESATKERP
ncbi:MAG: tail fiber domain-containing protein [Planctomycetota bacterium]